jgi:hypothetical protein
MPWWGAVILTLGASLITAGTALLVTRQQHRYTGARDAAARRDERLKSGADLLGAIHVLLIDADPDRLAINLKRDAPFDSLSPLRAHWDDQLRVPLASFAIAQSSRDIRATAEQLSVAITKALTSAWWMLRDFVSPRPRGRLADRDER